MGNIQLHSVSGFSSQVNHVIVFGVCTYHFSSDDIFTRSPTEKKPFFPQSAALQLHNVPDVGSTSANRGTLLEDQQRWKRMNSRWTFVSSTWWSNMKQFNNCGYAICYWFLLRPRNWKKNTSEGGRLVNSHQVGKPWDAKWPSENSHHQHQKIHLLEVGFKPFITNHWS